MKYTNNLNLPDAVVSAIINDPYPHGKIGDISVTSLIGPPQIRMLRKLYRGEIIEDVSDRLWALYGQIGHTILERAETKSDIQELRLFATILGWQISGQFDNLALYQDTLTDYKFTTVWSIVYPKIEWEQQLNCLSFLCRKNNNSINNQQVIVFLRDWSISKAKFDNDYPQKPIVVIPIKLWGASEQQKYISERVAIHQEAEHGNIPPCSDEERWATPQKFAVMKGSNKRATKLCDSLEQAEKYIDAHKDGKQMKIVERPREYKRCADYCNVAGFCPQYKEMP